MGAQHTSGPWGWQIEDYSMASLGCLPDPGLSNPLVLAVSPCKSCQDRANPKEWVWGRCHTPSEADARLIAAAPELLEALLPFNQLFWVGDLPDDHEFDGGYTVGDLRRVRAAVARATGAA